MNIAVTKPDETISTLNQLIETCRDGQKGFADAAESITRPDIKMFCLEQSRTRGQFVSQLQEAIRQLGGDPENTGSTSAALHRAWIKLKSALGGGDHMILAACETGEDSAVDTYEEALKSHLPINVHTLVEQQYQHIKQVHDRVKFLRDQLDE